MQQGGDAEVCGSSPGDRFPCWEPSLAAVWALLVFDGSKSDFPLPQGQKQQKWRENTTGPAQNMPLVLALPWHGQGKANSPELKALSQFSIFPKRGSLPEWISGLWRGTPSVAEWGCWRCSPCPRAGLAAAGGLQCSDPACSSCCNPHPETFPGNLPVPCCGLPKL